MYLWRWLKCGSGIVVRCLPLWGSLTLLVVFLGSRWSVLVVEAQVGLGFVFVGVTTIEQGHRLLGVVVERLYTAGSVVKTSAFVCLVVFWPQNQGFSRAVSDMEVRDRGW